jgi:hypothetical protein
VRNLTFGALVLVVGTVAALPFRRASVDTDPDRTKSTLATGPVSELAISNNSVTYDQLYMTPESTAATSASHSYGGPPASLASEFRSANQLRGIPSGAQPQPRRDLRLPLTYDDLAVPLSTPHYTDGRFEAFAGQKSGPQAPAQSPDQFANDARFQPLPVTAAPPSAPARSPWEIASDLPGSILDPAAPPQHTTARPPEQPTEPAPPGSVAGRLASDSRLVEQTAVKPEAVDRPRHWIRQPE